MSGKANEANKERATVWVSPQETDYIPDTRFECKPRYCYAPWGILRLAELILGISILCLVTITCNATACVDIMNEFGRVAPGQGYVVFAYGITAICTAILLILYSVNMHRVSPGCVAACERVYSGCAIVILLIGAVVESYYAAQADKDLINELGRGIKDGIRGNWIAASVLCWIHFIIYVVDFVFQFNANYPTRFSKV